MAEWTVRPLTEEDEEALLGLLTAAFGRWPGIEINVSPLEHLRWKLRSDPMAYAWHAVAEADGRLIGTRIVFVQRVKLRERTILCQAGFDNSTHPDFQDRGVLRAVRFFTLERIREEFDATLGLRPKQPAVRTVGVAAGQHLIGNSPRMLVAPRDSLPGRIASGARGWTVRVTSRFDERLDGFSAEALQPFEFAIERCAAYMNWRYCDPRAGLFTVLQAERRGRLLGYAVVAVSYGKGYIADTLVLPGGDDVLQSLLGEALRILGEAGVSSVECALPAHHPYREVFHAAGLKDGKRRLELPFVPGRVAYEDLAFLTRRKAAVHFMLGDFDLV